MSVFYVEAQRLSGQGPKTMGEWGGRHSSGEERAGSGGHTLQCELGTRDVEFNRFLQAGKRFVKY